MENFLSDTATDVRKRIETYEGSKEPGAKDHAADMQLMLRVIQAVQLIITSCLLSGPSRRPTGETTSQMNAIGVVGEPLGTGSPASFNLSANKPGISSKSNASPAGKSMKVPVPPPRVIKFGEKPAKKSFGSKVGSDSDSADKAQEISLSEMDFHLDPATFKEGTSEGDPILSANGDFESNTFFHDSSECPVYSILKDGGKGTKIIRNDNSTSQWYGPFKHTFVKNDRDQKYVTEQIGMNLLLNLNPRVRKDSAKYGSTYMSNLVCRSNRL